MRDFIRILKRFVPPYKKYMVLNIVFNVLSAILNLFSFALIIPILQILFKMDEGNYTFMDWNFNAGSWESWKALPELIKNNFFWYVSDLIEVHGGSFALIMLGIFLIVATFLKVATMYLAFYTMIPIRTGVVRDIRNQINKKITQLPLSFFSEERKGDIIARMTGDVQEVEASVMSSLDMHSHFLQEFRIFSLQNPLPLSRFCLQAHFLPLFQHLLPPMCPHLVHL